MSKSIYTTIKETTAPTTSTVGVVGQWYLDTTTKILYQCKSITTENNVNTYEWSVIGGKDIYKHEVRLGSSNWSGVIEFEIINDTATAYDLTSIYNMLPIDGSNYPCYGWVMYGSKWYYVDGIYPYQSGVYVNFLDLYKSGDAVKIIKIDNVSTSVLTNNAYIGSNHPLWATVTVVNDSVTQL